MQMQMQKQVRNHIQIHKHLHIHTATAIDTDTDTDPDAEAQADANAEADADTSAIEDAYKAQSQFVKVLCWDNFLTHGHSRHAVEQATIMCCWIEPGGKII